MWEPIATAPLNHDLELAVIDEEGPHALVFPCQRTPEGWVDTLNRRRVDVHPTHWRYWSRSD